MGTFQGVQTLSVETEKNLEKAKKDVAMMDLQHKVLTDKVASLMEELSSMHVERANFRADLKETTVLVERLNGGVGKLPSGVSTEVVKTYKDIVDPGNLRFRRSSQTGEGGWRLTFQMILPA